MQQPCAQVVAVQRLADAYTKEGDPAAAVNKLQRLGREAGAHVLTIRRSMQAPSDPHFVMTQADAGKEHISAVRTLLALEHNIESISSAITLVTSNLTQINYARVVY